MSGPDSQRACDPTSMLTATGMLSRAGDKAADAALSVDQPCFISLLGKRWLVASGRVSALLSLRELLAQHVVKQLFKVLEGLPKDRCLVLDRHTGDARILHAGDDFIPYGLKLAVCDRLPDPGTPGDKLQSMSQRERDH